MPSGVSGKHECKCGETDNVKYFHYFDNREPEYLCWDCRYQIINERVETDDETDNVVSGQTGLGDF